MYADRTPLPVQMAVEAIKPKSKRKPKSERKKLVDALDSIVSLIVRARDKRCVQCGTRERLTNGHLFSRNAYSTRWNLINCNCQCQGCNLTHDHDPYPYQEWWKKKYGEEEYHKLYQKWARTTDHHWSNMELRELLEEMKTIYARYV